MSSHAGDPGRRSSPSLGSHRRRDVLVDAEQVGRVVPVLRGDQPLVTLAVGVAQQLQGQGDVRLVLLRLLPVGLDAERDGRAPKA